LPAPLRRAGFAEQVRFMARGNFGERLKRERELREVSPNEVVVATRISLRFLEALENEDWDKLPGGIFNRGFVRAIARYLGLDEEHLLAEYDLARGDQVPEPAPSPENRIPSPPKWIIVALAVGATVVIAALVAAGVYGWRRYSAYRRSKSSSAITAPSPAVTQVASCVSLTSDREFVLVIAPNATLATML
jgi:cytoskeleton protein RodZ